MLFILASLPVLRLLICLRDSGLWPNKSKDEYGAAILDKWHYSWPVLVIVISEDLIQAGPNIWLTVKCAIQYGQSSKYCFFESYSFSALIWKHVYNVFVGPDAGTFLGEDLMKAVLGRSKRN